MNKKGMQFAAGIEMVLTIVSLVAFAYFIGLTNSNFPLVSAETKKSMTMQEFMDNLEGVKLIENETWKSYPISSEAKGAGCCFANKNGQVCGTATPSNCIQDSPFAEGALCADTTFCEKGCCYDNSSGIYDKNVLKIACPSTWIADPNCNLPAAELGCCVLGDNTIFETRGQCRIDTSVRALGRNGITDWRGGINEGECLALASVQKEGACLIGEDGCKFGTKSDCLSYGGKFAEGYLCTSPKLNTSCKMTKQTECAKGKDGVYFVDSCGNSANIYNAKEVNNVSYWDKIIPTEDSCGVGKGNGNSKTCGNCNRFGGGICASADKNNFKVDDGNFYCKDTSCMFDGVKYRNGESWCVYDGAIGNGNDVVGSRDWKYVCSQGTVQVEPCADYRNQICVQSKQFESDGKNVSFNNAACIANNWRACINLNGKENIKECSKTLNCRVDKINIADKFKFDVCLPKYPAGFSLDNPRYEKTATALCGMATQTCTVIRKSKTWGGCEYVANENCLSKQFGQEMNDFCRGLGDCGGSANIAGKWSGNYRISGSPMLSSSWIAKLVALSKPVNGQFAKVEDYSKYLATAGLIDNRVAPGSAQASKGMDMSMVSQGLSGIGMAMNFAATGKALGYSIMKTGVFGKSFATGYGLPNVGGEAGAKAIAAKGTGSGAMGASASAFAGAAIGASIGMVVGGMIAKQLGLSSGGSMLMSIGGAMVGAALGYYYVMTGMLALGIVGWVGIAIMVIASFFGGSDCPPITVKFECKPWQPPTGGEDCSQCNENPLKPCSAYRCESLGAGCELINKGSDHELCISGNPSGKTTAPVIQQQSGVSFKGGTYKNFDGGISIVNDNGGCLDAYTPLKFGIVTGEPTQCRFDISEKPFKEMSFDAGGNYYMYNHTEVFVLPDPSHGQSKGKVWSGKLNLFVKCQNRYGLVNQGYYKIKTCVKEGVDKTAPAIVATLPTTGTMVRFEAKRQNVSIITNELSQCRWDLSDKSYSEMTHILSCNDSIGTPSSVLGYKCTGQLAVGNATTDYYVRCSDQPWLGNSSKRNADSQSFVLKLKKPLSKISITKIIPTGEIKSNTPLYSVDLKVETSGGGDTRICSYSFSGYDNMIKMFETGESQTHSQVLNLGMGKKILYVRCEDETGDFAQNSTTFNISRRVPPAIIRVWQKDGYMNLILSKRGECRFSTERCNFDWDSGANIGVGTELQFSVIKGKKYYIQCNDDGGSVPTKCSAMLVGL